MKRDKKNFNGRQQLFLRLIRKRGGVEGRGGDIQATDSAGHMEVSNIYIEWTVLDVRHIHKHPPRHERFFKFVIHDRLFENY